jgi:outer membrane biosynthesis protein TonB
MSQATAPTSGPTNNTPSDKSKPPAPAVGTVPFSLVLLSAILALLPGTRSTGIFLLVLLTIPALVVWIRARSLTDGSRGLTTSTLVIGISALVLGAALSPHEEAPTTTPASAPPSVPQLTAPASPPVAVAPAPQTLVAPQPAVQQLPTEPAVQTTVPEQFVQVPTPAKRPVPTVARAPRVVPAPAPRTVEAEQSDQTAAYYKNCAAARAAGAAPLRTGDPGYRAGLDRDSDGIACE